MRNSKNLKIILRRRKAFRKLLYAIYSALQVQIYHLVLDLILLFQ